MHPRGLTARHRLLARRPAAGLAILCALIVFTSFPAAAEAQASTGPSTVHTVQSGETLWDIANQYGLDVGTLELLNTLSDPNRIYPGQKLVVSIPDSASARLEYVIKPGDSLWTISRTYGLSLDQIMAANNIKDPSKIKAGDKIVLPLGVGGFDIRYAEYKVQSGDTLWGIAQRYKLPAAVVVGANPEKDPTKLKVGDVIRIPINSASVSLTSAVPAYEYAWPLKTGQISSEYGWRIHPITKERSFHSGVDVAAPQGTLVYAARSGRVIFTGVRGEYGNAILIEHDDGEISLYGHLSSIIVKTGSRVSQGQAVGRVGSTGRSTGPHLHFEIRDHNGTIDPVSATGVSKQK